MSDPFTITSPESIELLAKYLDDRCLEPADFPRGLVPINSSHLLIEKGYMATLAAGRPYIFLEYLDPYGKPYLVGDVPYATARFLGSPKQWRGAEPPPKVISPLDRPNVLHYEPIQPLEGQERTWSSLGEGQIVLHVESMIKAKAVHKWTGYPTIGLNGVNSYSSTKRGIRFLYEDQDIDFSRFCNVILFDSNTHKPAVARAREQLMFKFKHILGCKDVRFVDLPKSDTGEDQGPDDFLREKGNPLLIELIQKAEVYKGQEHDDLMLRMDRAVYCLRSGSVIDREDKNVRTPSRARDLYAPINEKTMAKGGRVQTVKGFDVWLESPQRTEVVNPTYEYLGEEFIDKEDGSYYNLYSPSGAWPDGSEGDECKPIVDHLRRNMSHEDVERLRSYLKYLKFTKGKPTSFPVLYSDKRGVGKGFFNSLASKLIGTLNSHVGSSETFATKFNVELEGKRLIMINELKVKGGDKDKVMNNIKTFIADPTTRIERKGVDAYTIDTNSGLIVNANALEDVPNDGMEDRRIWYVNVHFPEGGHGDSYWSRLWALLEDKLVMRSFAKWVSEGQDINFAMWRPPMDDNRKEAILASLGQNSVAAYNVLEKLRADPGEWVVVSLAIIRHLMTFENLPSLENMGDPSLAMSLKRDAIWKSSDKKYGRNGEQKRVWIVDEKKFQLIAGNGTAVNEEIDRATKELGKRSKF